jgi:hypothetical protein
MSPTLAAVFVLFNGNNLDGWKTLDGEWAVQNAAMVCQKSPAVIRSSFESNAFTLAFEYRRASHGKNTLRLNTHSDGTGGTEFLLTPFGLRWSAGAERDPAQPDDGWIRVEIEMARHLRATSSTQGTWLGELKAGVPEDRRGFMTLAVTQPGIEIRNLTAAEPGFKSLFDGKSTKGWEPVGKHDPDNPTWYVENGTLICRHTKWGNWLRTAQSYDSFILRLEYWLPRKGNSGIYLHAPATSERISQIGQEIQLIDDTNYPRLKPSQRAGSVYAGIAPEVEVPAPAEEWNAIEVLSQGKRIRTTLNGVELYDVRLDDANKDAQLLKNPLATRRLTGFIGLQDHTDSPRFRNIRIRVLGPASQPAG